MIAIVGAGIAGLTSALCFSKFGIKVSIFERVQKLEETGASIQLSANATYILNDLGLTEALSKLWTQPECVHLADAKSLSSLAQVPLGAFAKTRWHGPHANLKRADLQKVLLEAVSSDANCMLHLGQELDFSNQTALSDHIAKVADEAPALIIGADGVWSKVRDLLNPTTKPHQTPYVAWRFEADANSRAQLPSHIQHSGGIYLFLNSKAHIVFYPQGHDGHTNIVFVTNQHGSAASALDINQLVSSVKLHPSITACLLKAQQLGCWPIYEVDCPRWQTFHKGTGMVLIGDAAHAMTPFMAQGAAMAIEDAHVLAKHINAQIKTQNSDHSSNHSGNLESALQSFELQRRPRIGQVKKRAEFNRFAYHASGPVKFARNRVLSLKSSQSLAAELDWLYGWRAT